MNIKERSLELFAERLAEQTYPGYPPNEQRLKLPAEQLQSFGALVIPKGPWWVKSHEADELCDPQDFPTVEAFDSHGRPLHPWHKEILADKRIGAVAGKGFYWQWGPNKTGDPVIIRHDLAEPHVLLIERDDTGNPALAGGFFDEELDMDCLDTALREASEESLLFDFTKLRSLAKIAIATPVADIRSTLHAWPETTVARLDLPNDIARNFTEMSWDGSKEVRRAFWEPVSTAPTKLFGSHNVLLDIALEDT